MWTFTIDYSIILWFMQLMHLNLCNLSIWSIKVICAFFHIYITVFKICIVSHFFSVVRIQSGGRWIFSDGILGAVQYVYWANYYLPVDTAVNCLLVFYAYYVSCYFLKFLIHSIDNSVINLNYKHFKLKINYRIIYWMNQELEKIARHVISIKD